MRKSEIDESVIVAKILSGDEKALWFFYTHFKRPITTYISNRIADSHDAEEIVQDTLLSTLEALRDFSFRCSLFTFLCSIANHKVIDFYRKKKLKSIVFSKIAEIEPLISTLLGPEEMLDEKFLGEKIKETFTRLAPKYSHILKLKYIEGFSVEEIAQKLSISFKSAESRLFRARKAFVLAFSP